MTVVDIRNDKIVGSLPCAQTNGYQETPDLRRWKVHSGGVTAVLSKTNADGRKTLKSMEHVHDVTYQTLVESLPMFRNSLYCVSESKSCTQLDTLRTTD